MNSALNQKRIEELKVLKPKITTQRIPKSTHQDIRKHIQDLAPGGDYEVWGLSTAICRFWNEDHKDLTFSPQRFRIYSNKAKVRSASSSNFTE
jgi:hypothetical protein